MPHLYEGGPNATPTYHSGKIYTISRKGDIFCLNADDGKVVWEANAADVGAKPPEWGFSGFPTILGDVVYFNSGDNGLALNKDTGKVVWSSGGKGAGYAGPIPFLQAGKQALALFSASGLKAVLAKDGSTLWEFNWDTSYDVNAASPIFLPDGNRIFISSGYRTGCAMLEMRGTKVRELWRSENLATQFSTAAFHDGYIYGIHGDANRRGSLVCMNAEDGSVAWFERLGFGSLVISDGKLLVLNERGKLFTVDPNPEAYKQLDEREILSPRCWTVPTVVNGALFARNSYGNLVRFNLK
jgi:outer membrane protein assembly factor BamB